MVYRNDYRHSELLEVLNVYAEVHDALFERFYVLLSEVGLCNAAVVLQCTDSRYKHGAIRLQTSVTALDVKEFLSAEVRAEASLGDGVISELHSKLCRSHGVAAVRDVRERTAVDKRRVALESLYKVRVDGVLEKRGHCADCVQVARENGLPGICVSNQDIAQALL